MVWLYARQIRWVQKHWRIIYRFIGIANCLAIVLHDTKYPGHNCCIMKFKSLASTFFAAKIALSASHSGHMYCVCISGNTWSMREFRKLMIAIYQLPFIYKDISVFVLSPSCSNQTGSGARRVGRVRYCCAKWIRVTNGFSRYGNTMLRYCIT